VATRSGASDGGRFEPAWRDRHEVPMGPGGQRTPSHHRSPDRCWGASATFTRPRLRVDWFPVNGRHISHGRLLGGNGPSRVANESDIRDQCDSVILRHQPLAPVCAEGTLSGDRGVTERYEVPGDQHTFPKRDRRTRSRRLASDGKPVFNGRGPEASDGRAGHDAPHVRHDGRP